GGGRWSRLQGAAARKNKPQKRAKADRCHKRRNVGKLPIRMGASSRDDVRLPLLDQTRYQYGPQTDFARATVFLAAAVADEKRVPRTCLKRIEREPVDPSVRFADAERERKSH